MANETKIPNVAEVRGMTAALGTPATAEKYNAAGNGTTDDTAALNALFASGVTDYLLRGSYRVTGKVIMPPYTSLRGINKKTSKIILDGPSAELVRSAYTRLNNLRVEINHASGKGITFPSGQGGQIDDGVELNNSAAGPCLTFVANSGSGFSSVHSSYYTSAAPMTRAAIDMALDALDSGATPRKFTNVDSGGCTLFNFGGANDTMVSNFYSNGLIFSDNSNKVQMSGVRIGAAGAIGGRQTIRGAQLVLLGVCAVPIDNYAIDSNIMLEAPNSDIADLGVGGNKIVQPLAAYTPILTTSVGAYTNPTLGNSTLTGYWSRNGKLVHVQIELVIGSTFAAGNGFTWYFSLPIPEYTFGLTSVDGSGYILNGATAAAIIAVKIEKGFQKVSMPYPNAGVNANVGPSKPAVWAAGDTIRLSLNYYAK
jgi:hypothetical protein